MAISKEAWISNAKGAWLNVLIFGAGMSLMALMFVLTEFKPQPFRDEQVRTQLADVVYPQTPQGLHKTAWEGDNDPYWNRYWFWTEENGHQFQYEANCTGETSSDLKCRLRAIPLSR